MATDLVLTAVPGSTADPEWEVWVALQDGDPRKQAESFIIGCGDSEKAAWAAALRTTTGLASRIIEQLEA